MSQARRNRRTAALAFGLVVAMGGMAYAAVPLYEIFCQATGYAGTPQRADAESDQILDREIKVRFNADKERDLPWSFQPVQKEVRIRVGENTLAFFRAKNESDEPVTGMATYNITPATAGAYFAKVECFCFTEQVLMPGQQVDMPVSFYIDPDIADDPNMDHIRTLTLSYTFYRQQDSADMPAGQVRVALESERPEVNGAN